MSMWEEYQAAAQAAKPASRQAGRIGATDVDRHRAYAAKQEMLRLEDEYQKSAQLNAVIPAAIQQQLADRLLATMRQELKDLLPHPLRGLTENFTDDEAPLVAMLDAQGQAYWGPDMWAGGASVYSSYFRVIDASTTDPDVCKIGVTNGSAAMLDPLGSCGTVKINNERADVAAVTETLSAAGTYYVWIHSWIDAADGPNAEIIVGPVDDDTPPDNPNGGVAFANQLAGRVTVEDDAITSITQDYLRGGEHFELLFGDCAGEDLTP